MQIPRALTSFHSGINAGDISRIMKNNDTEKYYFYRLYSIDFDSTKHALRILKRYMKGVKSLIDLSLDQ